MNNHRLVSAIIGLALVGIVLVTFAGCRQGGTYESEFQTIGDKGWSRNAPLVFVLDDSLERSEFDMLLHVRHDNYYPYRNLWIAVDFFSDGVIADRDTLNIELSDKYGKWHGAGLGRLFQRSLPIKTAVLPGTYERVVFWQVMRCDTLYHIENIGLTLQRHDGRVTEQKIND